MMQYRGIPAGYEDDEENGEDLTLDYIMRQNLKIRIVPDITTGAGLNGENFDGSLSAEMDNWFDSYREHWNSYKSTPLAKQNLKMVFMRDAAPLLLALKFFANCPGCNNLKNKNLALFILETICDLYKQNPDIAATCDDNTRMIAFNFVKTCGIVSVYKAVMETYELSKIRELLIVKVKDLIEQGHFRDAAYWAMHLKITHVFDIYDIVFPLILQDKIFLAEEYLDVAKEQQLPIVQFLDSLLNKQKTVLEHCDEILAKYNYKDIKHNVLSYRPMSKLVSRLAKKYKIEAHLTSNLNFTKACSYLHYLYRKYQDGGMSCAAWRELVRDTANTKALQIDLVSNITLQNNVDEATYWAKHFKLSNNDCPNAVKTNLVRQSSDNNDGNCSAFADTVDAGGFVAGAGGAGGGCGAIGKSKNTNLYTAQSQKQQYQPQQQQSQPQPQGQSEFLTLQLPAESILLVDDKAKFLEMLAYLEEHMLVAFDSEWKPSIRSENVVSLLQLATIERVYLLDCLSPHITDDLWRLLGRKIFNNLEILKIGFSLHQDLRMLHKSLPLQLNLQATSCYLDLREMWRRLKYMQIVRFPYGCGNYAGESLCALTELCLGKKLDKSNQCSNWANRPLRHDQIVYAALDAHCLLKIYQVLAEILLRMGLDIDQVVDEITTAKTGYLFNMKRLISDQIKSVNSAGSINTSRATRETLAKSVSDIKFLCDGMLLGLSKELRKLGIDCIDIMKADINYYIDLAKHENRYILTRDTRYAMFASELPQQQCIQVPTDSSVEQVLNVISYLGIEIHERNLFTRCLQCNGNEFILVLKSEMQLMRFGQLLESDEQTKNAMQTNPYEKTFNLVNVNEHIIRTKTTFRGKPIKLNKIKTQLFRTKEHFYVCDNCGVCSWDGAHNLDASIMLMVRMFPLTN